MATYRTEFAIDDVWYTNALRFDTVEAAVAEATGRFARWTMPLAWRVVTDDVPQKQEYGGLGDPTACRATDATGAEITMKGAVR